MPKNTHTLTVLVATESDRPVLEQLWTMFRHDMSAYSGAYPDERGRFRQERLDNALQEPTWRGYIVRLGDLPAGLCIVRGIGSPEQIISSFFLVNAARRSGYGRAVVRTVISQHRGRWAVAFQESNRPAAAFWRTLADETDPEWTEQPPRAVEAGLAMDSWIRFRVQ